MSKEELSDFIYASRRNLSLRTKLMGCRDKEGLLTLASKYGFKINYNDLREDLTSERINEWHLQSKIKPLKNSF
ncbi:MULTISPECIES: Nif11-like leader peptide family natural product precursor [Prochlorococcus]|uniref:Nif11-like leader peptide family natural product precursor n=1 Tax=Prochlorococcus TaxID=1218 RepID=UPI0005338FD6|nr:MULTISPECIES: Nif11-like leader peptide family natural product precursor [Prochlorococcus]KGG12276.1 hypothetical protein EV05_1486 [Prochlorococcus sp. MIT 0601]